MLTNNKKKPLFIFLLIASLFTFNRLHNVAFANETLSNSVISRSGNTRNFQQNNSVPQTDSGNLSNQASQVLKQLINGVVKMILDIAYESDPILPQTIELNRSHLEANQKISEAAAYITQNKIKKTLTNYEGFSGLTDPVNKKQDEKIEKYIDYLESKANRPQDIVHPNQYSSNGRPDIEDTQTIQDSHDLISKTLSMLYYNHVKKTEGEENSPFTSAYQEGDNEKKIKDLITNNSALANSFETLLKEKKNCPPFPKGNKADDPYPDCALDSTSEFDLKQAMLRVILTKSTDLTKEFTEKDADYDINALLTPLSYDTTANEKARKVLAHIEKLVPTPNINPPQLPMPLTEEQAKNLSEALDNTTAGKADPIQMLSSQQNAYSNLVRNFITAKGVVMNLLYHLYATRAEIPVLASKGLRDFSGKPITSAMQLKSFMAKRRLNRSWYEAISQSSYKVGQVEIASLLSEIHNDLFENQLATERLTAVIAIIALQGLKGMADSVNSQAEGIRGQIQNLLSGDQGQQVANNAANNDVDSPSQSDIPTDISASDSR